MVKKLFFIVFISIISLVCLNTTEKLYNLSLEQIDSGPDSHKNSIIAVLTFLELHSRGLGTFQFGGIGSIGLIIFLIQADYLENYFNNSEPKYITPEILIKIIRNDSSGITVLFSSFNNSSLEKHIPQNIYLLIAKSSQTTKETKIFEHSLDTEKAIERKAADKGTFDFVIQIKTSSPSSSSFLQIKKLNQSGTQNIAGPTEQQDLLNRTFFFSLNYSVASLYNYFYPSSYSKAFKSQGLVSYFGNYTDNSGASLSNHNEEQVLQSIHFRPSLVRYDFSGTKGGKPNQVVNFYGGPVLCLLEEMLEKQFENNQACENTRNNEIFIISLEGYKKIQRFQKVLTKDRENSNVTLSNYWKKESVEDLERGIQPFFITQLLQNPLVSLLVIAFEDLENCPTLDLRGIVGNYTPSPDQDSQNKCQELIYHCIPVLVIALFGMGFALLLSFLL